MGLIFKRRVLLSFYIKKAHAEALNYIILKLIQEVILRVWGNNKRPRYCSLYWLRILTRR